MQRTTARRWYRNRTVGAPHRWTLVVCCLAFLSGSAGCGQGNPSAAQQVAGSAAPAAQDAVPDVLATIGDEQITMADIRERAGDDLDQIEIRYQLARNNLLQTTLNQILRDRVLVAEAQKQGISAQQLIEAEAGGTLEPSEVEIKAWYDSNTDRVGGRTLDQVRSQIADFLRNQRGEDAARKLEKRLNQERQVTVLLQPYRVPFDNSEAPKLGPDNAAVKVVEFSDFQCPFCGRFFGVLKQVEQNFGEQIQLIYRQYPLPSLHPNAQKAAEASLCAQEQGKFWELHDLMFQEQDKLTVRELKEKAGRLGMDQKEFDSCLDTGRYVERVQEDQKEGVRAGVTGTPALFLNGVPLAGGAVTYEVAAAAIQDEIDRARK